MTANSRHVAISHTQTRNTQANIGPSQLLSTLGHSYS